MNEHIDMKISGASSMPGGEYGRVSISGAGKVQGLSLIHIFGRGIAKKLEEKGLFTMGDIARCSLGRPDEFYNEELLYRMFGCLLYTSRRIHARADQRRRKDRGFLLDG